MKQGGIPQLSGIRGMFLKRENGYNTKTNGNKPIFTIKIITIGRKRIIKMKIKTNEKT